MSSDPSAPYSDIDFARLLTRRLRNESERGSAASSSARPQPHPRYVRFDAGRFLPGSMDLASTGRGRTFGAGMWNQLLDGCMSAADADSAFLMEPQGLVVAARGLLGAEAAEGVGARLMLALDQAEQMSTGDSKSVCVEFELRWLTGLRFKAGESRLTMGVVAPSPLGREIRDVIEELLTAVGAGT